MVEFSREVVGVGGGRAAVDQFPEVHLVAVPEGSRAAGELRGDVVELGVVQPRRFEARVARHGVEHLGGGVVEVV
jgi:hypothetical protein